MSQETVNCIAGKRALVLLYSDCPGDPRPTREAEALAEAGMDVEMICVRYGDQPSNESHKGIQVTRLGVLRKRKGKVTYIFQYLLFTLLAFFIASARALTRKYAIVHVHNMPDFLVFAAAVPRLLGAKIILDLHDPMPEVFMSIFQKPESHRWVRLLKRVERWSIRFADLVLTPNLAFKQVFVSRGAPSRKVNVVMNTPQTEIFNADRLPAGASNDVKPESQRAFSIVYHGSLVERHGLDLAVRAVAKLREQIPGLKLEIYGEENEYTETVTELAEDLGVATMVSFKGWCPHEKIAEAISAADLGIIPNRRSVFTEINLPTRIFEYLALKKPVIAPRTRGIRDYFDDSQLIMFDPEKPESLAQKIEWVWKNRSAARVILENGRSVLKQHQWPLERNNFVALVNGLIIAASSDTVRDIISLPL
jgi:glycosyltransferase involved in cell wall biosynthesis